MSKSVKAVGGAEKVSEQRATEVIGRNHRPGIEFGLICNALRVGKRGLICLKVVFRQFWATF